LITIHIYLIQTTANSIGQAEYHSYPLVRSPPLDVVLSELTPGPVCPQNPGPCGELHHPRAHPRQLRLRRPVQQGGGGGLARQGDQPQPPADAGTAAGHIGRVAQTRSSEFLGPVS